MNESRKRVESRISDDMCPVFPNKKIDCADCRFRQSGLIGFKSGYCEIYPRGKPNAILFDGAKCQFKIEEAPA